MTNVKSYKDGNRFILVVENCTGELAVKVNSFLSEIMGIDPPKEVPALNPVKVAEEQPPKLEQLEPIQELQTAFEAPPTESEVEETRIPEGPYKGMTVKDALWKDGLPAAITICVMYKKFPGKMQQQILAQCKEILLQDLKPRNPDMATTFEIEGFFKLYQPLITKGIHQVLQMAGYSELQDFISFADEDMLRESYYSVLENLKERIQKSA